MRIRAGRSLLPLAALALAVGALAYGGLIIPRETGRVSPVWFANAVVLAMLLRSAPKTWPAWLAAAFAGNVVADLAVGDSLATSVALCVCNAVEVVLAAGALRRLCGGDFDAAKPRHLSHLGGVALGASLVSALAASLYLGLIQSGDVLGNLAIWTFGDALGLSLLTPCLLIIADWRRHLAARPFSRQAGFALAALAGIDLVAFGQERYPLLFLIPPALLAVGLTLELLGSVAAITMTAAVAVAFTAAGRGPIAIIEGGWTEKLILEQMFIALTLGVVLHMAAVHRRRREAAAALEEARAAAEAESVRVRAAKAEYRLIAERATDIISRIAVTGEFLFLSPSLKKVTGYAPEDLIGKQFGPQVHPDDRAALLAEHVAMARGKRAPGAPLRYRVMRKEGGWLWLESNPSVVRDDAGHPVEFIDVARDVTERMELEARLETMREEAERAAEVKSEFLANMSHEIRTPLTSIVGFASLLAEQQLGGQADRYVNRVAGASRSLLALVNDVLDFSKLEVGKLELKPRPTDPAACAREVAELFSAQAGAKGVALEVEAPDAPTPVLVDPDRLRQVLMNLVGNAVKFTERGSVTVRMAYAAGRLRFAVVDTGPGMDEEARGKLFQRFSQVDASTTRAHGGTGLGLAICKGLVEAMGGEIGVESRVGEGSTFWFEAPAEACLRPDEGAAAELDLAALIGVRVLVVDDNAANRELVASLLRPMGVAVEAAPGGAEAVVAAAEAPFDVILMDLRMPEVDGWAAAQAIREGDGPNRDVPILAFSADITADRQQISEVFQAVVRKPVDLNELIGAVARWTGPDADWEDADARVA